MECREEMFSHDGILTDEDCRIALYNHSKTKSAKFESFSIRRINSVDGFGGQYFKVKIHYDNEADKHTEHCFLKVLSRTCKFVFDICVSMNAYGKEEFLYNFLIKEFNTHGIDTSYAPNFYTCRPHLFLLEDMSQRGYKIVPKKDMLNVEHCKVALKSLAKYHTSAIIYEEIKSKELGSSYGLLEAYPKKFEEKIFSGSSYSRWFKSTIEGILQIIDLLPANEITAEAYKKKLLDEIETFRDLAEPSKKYRNTTIHGDLWSNNVMFRYEDDKPVDAILIDYQLLQWGTPALDVVELIFKNVRRHLRSKSCEELLVYYYEHFCECLQKHGIKAGDILTLDDFLKSCDDVRLMRKVLATAAHSVTFLVDDAIEEAFASEEAMEILFYNRSREITSSYINNDLYREVLQEDLNEVRDLLFCK